MVNDASEARAILDCMKYVPEGKRGVALSVAHDHYSGGAVLDKLAAANRRTTFFAQIETAAGVKNADAIAAVDGVDCLWVGHFDLSASLGIPGQFDHPKFKDAIARTYAACRKHDKAYGRLVPDVATGIDIFGHGVPNLPLLIWEAAEGGTPAELSRVWGIALVLLGLILIANISARLLLARSRRKMGL